MLHAEKGGSLVTIHHVRDIGVEATWSAVHANHDPVLFAPPTPEMGIAQICQRVLLDDGRIFVPCFLSS
jgi:hypothetical protein